MAAKTSEWRPGPTVCRCCLSEGCYKDISTEYFWMGKREVYSEMLSDTFSVSIAYSKSGGPNSNSRLICEPCISRLRDAADFRRQVLECEKTFMNHLDPGASGNVLLNDIEAVTGESADKDIKLERVKLEKTGSDDDDFDFGVDAAHDDDDDDDDDDLDDQPLTKLASKIPKKESVDLLDLLDSKTATVKRKSSVKAPTPAKKVKAAKKEVKATASKVSAKPVEKKKKECQTGDTRNVKVKTNLAYKARRNAKIVLKYSTAYPFRLPLNDMMCVYCSEKYNEPEQYREHMEAEHKTFNVNTAFAHAARNEEYVKADCTNLACRLCGKPFDTLQSVMRHLGDVHAKKILINADIGLQVFKLGREKWVCAVCNQKFAGLRTLSRHTTTHYRKYTCETCGRSYAHKENLNSHVILTHSDGKPCPKCKICFPNLQARKEHILETMACWPYRCGICGERFLCQKYKHAHLYDVHGEAQKKHRCRECGEEFNEYRRYKTHFVISHTNEGYQCPYCDMQFENKRYFNDHKVMHTKEKGYPCTVCDKSFGRKKNLEQHMWIHSEYKRFDCKLCNRQFSQRISWKIHMRTHHPQLVDFD